VLLPASAFPFLLAFTTTNHIYEVDVLMRHFSYNAKLPGRKVKFTENGFGDQEF
jgi:hypothetical protein